MKTSRSTSLRLAPVAAVLTLVLAGCSSVKLDESDKAPVTTSQPSTGQATSTVAPVQVQSANADPLSGVPRTVYFDFDSYVVKDEFRPVVEAHAKALNTDRSKREVLEGHTDARGGSEYNLALGQKRAEAVLKSLTLLGVQAGQVEAVSFGKERPAAEGTGEEAWAKNRRVELKLR